jgi:hypothetical protein
MLAKAGIQAFSLKAKTWMARLRARHDEIKRVPVGRCVGRLI